MEHIKGTQLAFGVTSSGMSGVHEQSSERTKLGDLKEYKDKDGKTISVYATDNTREEISFEALIETSATDYSIGDEATVASINGIVTAYKIIESNEDVKKVQMTIRTYPDVQ